MALSLKYFRTLIKTISAAQLNNPGAYYSNSAETPVRTVNIVIENGRPRLYIPLPSRQELCIFTLKPLQDTVGDLVNDILTEDRGIDRLSFLNPSGQRIAKSNGIADLLSSNFQLLVNDERYLVDVSSISSKFSSPSKELCNIQATIARLAAAVHSEQFHLHQQRELECRIEDVSVQLEPFEEKRLKLSEQAAQRTRCLTWLGLGAMGLQFGFLARLTWWEYSWDIMEPVTYFVGYGTSMAMYAYYVITRQDYSFPQVFNREYLKRFYSMADRKSFDVIQYNELRQQLADLQSELRRLRDPLLCHLPLQQTTYLLPDEVNQILVKNSESSDHTTTTSTTM